MDLLQLLDQSSNISSQVLEQLDLNERQDDFGQFYSQSVADYQYDTVRLENGAEGLFVRRDDLDPTKKHPMITMIHGGPFSASPYQMFLITRNLYLLQGYCILIVNYRGSIGFGEDLLNSLLGNIGVNDVHDVGQLTQLTVKEYEDIVDKDRLGVEGGSHGGFLTGHLIG